MYTCWIYQMYYYDYYEFPVGLHRIRKLYFPIYPVVSELIALIVIGVADYNHITHLPCIKWPPFPRHYFQMPFRKENFVFWCRRISFMNSVMFQYARNECLHMNRCFIDHWPLLSKVPGNSYQLTKVIMHENEFEKNIVFKTYCPCLINSHLAHDIHQSNSQIPIWSMNKPHECVLEGNVNYVLLTMLFINQLREQHPFKRISVNPFGKK